MNKFKKITKQELLAELEKRLPDFTTDEFIVLFSWIEKYHSAIMKLIQKKSPQVYTWVLEKHKQLEQEQTDKKAEKLKLLCQNPKVSKIKSLKN